MVLFAALVGGLGVLSTAGALRVTALHDGHGNPQPAVLLTPDGGEIRSGALVLTDDDATTAMFRTAEMLPGRPVTACIALTYTGSATPTQIRLFATSSGPLAQYLDVRVDVGDGGSFGDCTGFAPTDTIYAGTLAEFSRKHADWSTSLATFTASTTPAVRTVRFTAAVQDDQSAQGATTSAGFTWQTRQVDEHPTVLLDAWGDEESLPESDRHRLQL
jgi:hypothetical protein